MEFSLSGVLGMARDSIREPREGAAQVMALKLPPVAGWTALMLLAVLSALMTHLSIALMPAKAQEFLSAAVMSPIRTAILQWIVMLVSVHAAHKIGRWRGGHGSLEDTVVLIAWLQFILLLVQMAQLVTQVIVPPLADWLGLAGILLFFWLLTNFVAELHGFRSRWLTFMGIVVTLLVVSVILGFIFALFIGAPQVGA